MATLNRPTNTLRGMVLTMAAIFMRVRGTQVRFMRNNLRIDAQSGARQTPDRMTLQSRYSCATICLSGGSGAGS
jgi:hypothetical protein